MKIINKVLVSVEESDIKNGKFTNKVVTEVADGCFNDMSDLHAVSLPKVTKIGSDCFRYNNALTEVSLRNKKYRVKDVDGYCFVITAEKTAKGIRIYTGYNLLGVKKGSIINEVGFVAEKDNFTAHGETVKKAIGDLQFKIIAEKLQNDPIKPDTTFTVKYYRLLTGACDMGCRSWLTANNIPFDVVDGNAVEKEPIKAKDLLPLLQKTGAYGLDKFKSLITF